MTYADSSALISVILEQPGSNSVQGAIAKLSPLFGSNLLEAEVRATMVREGVDDTRVEAIIQSMRWVNPSRPLSDEYRRILAVGYVKGADLLHLACALYLSPDPKDLNFLTLDTQQAVVARALGFRVLP